MFKYACFVYFVDIATYKEAICSVTSSLYNYGIFVHKGE